MNPVIPKIRSYLNKAGEAFLFEPNDSNTRNMFRLSVSAFLQWAVENDMIKDFAVVCDENNNKPEHIENNELRLDVAVKPSEEAEFVYLPVTLRPAEAA